MGMFEVKDHLYTHLTEQMPGEDVLFGLPAGESVARAGWVSVHGGAATLTDEVTAESLQRYDFHWTFQIVCSSGPGHASPRDADRVAYSLADKVLDIIEADHTLGGLVYNTDLDAVTRTESWEDPHPDKNPLHTILVVSITSTRRGNE